MIRTIARKGFRFVGDVSDARRANRQRRIAPQARPPPPRKSPRPSATAAELPRLQFPLLDRPAIAVLPFANISGEPEQEYFSEGISEDIITALSKLRWFYVIARNSAFIYKGRRCI